MPGYAIPFFHPQVIEPLKKFILGNGSERKLKKGECYKHSDEQLKNLAFIESGLCYYVYETEEMSNIFAVCPPGSIMGDATFLAPMNLPLNIYARRDTKLIVVPLTKVERFCKETRETFEAVVANSILKFQSYAEGMLINATRTPEERLKFLIKAIILWHDSPQSHWSALDLRLSNMEFGEIIHTSRITVNRILNGWKKEGLLKRENGITFVRKEIYEDIEL